MVACACSPTPKSSSYGPLLLDGEAGRKVLKVNSWKMEGTFNHITMILP